MDITINAFRGSIPRLADHLLPSTAASRALDCKLWHGTIDSWRDTRRVHALTDAINTSIKWDCCWLDFHGCVDIALGSVLCRELFVTGHFDYPAVARLDEECNLTWSRLGLPCTQVAMDVELGAVNDTVPKDLEGRSYAYQYVKSTGERGSLSAGSSAQLIRDGQTVILSGWEIPDASWDITHIRIFRTVTGHQQTNEVENILDTHWMLVAEIPIGAGVYVDTKRNDVLIEALEEDIASPPPDGLKGIVYLANMNTLAGFVGNRLYFSANNNYHHWPHYMDLDDNIKSIVESNGLIYAATDGHPYVIKGDADCQSADCRQAIRHAVSLPMMGFGSRRMEAIPNGAVYASKDGLVAMLGTSPPVIITHPLYAPDDWQALIPESIVPIAHKGRLFVFGARGSFALNLPNSVEQGWDYDTHTELSDRVKDAFVHRNGELYLHKTDGIYWWEGSPVKRVHVWESPEYVTGVNVNFAAGRLVNDNGAEYVRITSDGRDILGRSINSSQTFMLPLWGTGTRFKVYLAGVATVKLFSMASSTRELKS